MHFDLPIEDLRSYQPAECEPADFDAFWARTLAEARTFDLDPHYRRHDTALNTVDVFDCSFSGFGGHRIGAWLVLPKDRPAGRRLPCVVTYLGYGDGRGMPHSWILLPAAGYAQVAVDTRGQGTDRRPGHTPDPAPTTEPQPPGMLCRGVLDKDAYYYRRVFTDAVRAVDLALSHPDIDPSRVAVSGISQGGGISLAAASLHSDVAAALVDVPFLCHFRRAVTITDTLPYHELVRYWRTHRDRLDQAQKTLDYFDGINLARRASAPALFSAGLMDDVCPPSTVFGAYNRYAGPKQIEVYPFNGHEGGGEDHVLRQLDFLAQHLGK